MAAGRRRVTLSVVDDSTLFPHLVDPDDSVALQVADGSLSYRDLATATSRVATRLRSFTRAAIWMTPSLEAMIAVVASLRAGIPAIPLNPRAGTTELQHIINDARPDVVLCPPNTRLHPPTSAIPSMVVGVDEAGHSHPQDRTPHASAAALIIYTSGTTGPPKGVVLSRRALITNLDALAEAWSWTDADTIVHSLPLFHVHGLILGTVGPLRRGGQLHHLQSWSENAVGAALQQGATMLFAVPTMYHRLVTELRSRPDLVSAVRRARLLVSGSAPLLTADADAFSRLTGRRIVQRYGLTETLINCAGRAMADDAPDSVGPPLRGVELRLVDDTSRDVSKPGADALGEVLVRGPNLFTEYLGRPTATAEAFREGWFRTGDVAWRDEAGRIYLVGRLSQDFIKSGGFKIGANEVEAALTANPAVAEAAVRGEPDDDLGERVAAWVVLHPDHTATAEELIDFVASRLTPHKRPRSVHFVGALPRNEMGKLLKDALR